MTGSVLFLQAEFSLNPSQIGWVVGSSLLGCAMGALLSAPLSSFYHRKLLVFGSTFLYAACSFVLANTYSLNSLYLLRLILGVGMGISAFSLPLYVAELSPKEKRGALVSIYQFAITLGILIAFAIGFLNSDEMAWRPFFFFNGIIALVFLFATPIFPKSVLQAEKVHFDKQTLTKYRYPLLIGILMATFQQFTGINAVIFYAPTILQKTGVTDHGSLLLLTSAIGLVNSLTTLFCIAIIDKVGRRPLLFAGLTGMLFSYLLLMLTENSTSMTLIGLMGFIAAFAMGIGPLFWVVCSEIFPEKVRGLGMSLATLTVWVSNFIVSSTFLLIVEEVDMTGAFLLYGSICFAALFFVKRCVPETKGRSLQSMEKLWVVKSPPG